MDIKKSADELWARYNDPVIAAAVWVIVILLCLFSAEDLKSFVESVGDLGPVIFAWLVYQLGRQQYRSQADIADREHRRELFALRLDVIRKAEKLADELGWSPQVEYPLVSEAVSLAQDGVALFAADLMPIFDNLLLIARMRFESEELLAKDISDTIRMYVQDDIKRGREWALSILDNELPKLRATLQVAD